MKIALLCPEDDEELGSGEIVADLLKMRLKETADQDFEFRILKVFNNEFPQSVDEFDGFIISGSHYSVNQNFPWMTKMEKFIQKLYASGKVLAGICFGHQIIAKSFGGEIGINPSGKLRFYSENVVLNRNFKDKWTKELKDQCSLIQNHYEQIISAPNSAMNVASSNGCKHEILIYGRKILTMQGHPEISVALLNGTVIPMMRKRKYCSEEEIKRAERSLRRNADNDMPMRLLADFFKNQGV